MREKVSFYEISFFFELILATKKKTLLLDLDETLIHTCQLKEDPEHVVLVPTENGGKISVSLIKECFFKDNLILFDFIIF